MHCRCPSRCRCPGSDDLARMAEFGNVTHMRPRRRRPDSSCGLSWQPSRLGRPPGRSLPERWARVRRPVRTLPLCSPRGNTWRAHGLCGGPQRFPSDSPTSCRPGCSSPTSRKAESGDTWPLCHGPSATDPRPASVIAGPRDLSPARGAPEAEASAQEGGRFVSENLPKHPAVARFTASRQVGNPRRRADPRLRRFAEWCRGLPRFQLASNGAVRCSAHRASGVRNGQEPSLPATPQCCSRWCPWARAHD